MALIDPKFDYSHIALIFLYVLLSVFSIVSYIRSTTKETLFTICFHLILLVASLFRAVSFLLFIINEERVKYIDGNLLFLTNELPSFFYLTFFSMSLILSVEIFQGSLVVKAVNMEKLKIVVEVSNVVLYIILAVLFTLDFVLFPDESASVDQPSSVFQIIIQVVVSFIYLSTSIGFFVFLLKTYYEHYDSKFADALKTQESVQFKKKSNSIIFFTFLCFLVRSIMTCLSIFLALNFWLRDLIYYSIFEILPISLLMYIINDMAQKAGFNNSLFRPYKPLTENSKLTETSGYLYSKYSSSNS
ncbi:hypothetical protein DICPUDRAFT_45904 [Dictyostelium purpureum]|uniref:THH1/TOM1/TOM3 domain-containing protein n=1 Tax=Dictyostelium purpureum TaxID=5786 RepID=F0ZCJ1_DICPU|nr:uncharacterized protein DICPUDRAFT_45904 [Dictyostelium purpureum]EGC38379.1 hypothetical protein DICPUDRAFT_45904 [Dictyostelium purpureum]|eukprot:XP_003285136.1 hypothetical protein DICPUDRAFT_45904 [Dictyostelium purpureum]